MKVNVIENYFVKLFLEIILASRLLSMNFYDENDKQIFYLKLETEMFNKS